MAYFDRWEYLVVGIPDEGHEEFLNKHGNQGWELVLFGRLNAYFKRPFGWEFAEKIHYKGRTPK